MYERSLPPVNPECVPTDAERAPSPGVQAREGDGSSFRVLLPNRTG